MAQVLERPQPASLSEEARIVLPDSQALPRKLWTLEECRQLIAAGLLEEGGRYELLEGEIIDKMTFNEPHIYVSSQVHRALAAIFGFDYVRPAAPVALNRRNGPEPDAAVMVRPLRDYLQIGTPPPQDARLVVEVSDATLRTDLQVKSHLYARAGIPEYWVVNVNARTLHVFHQPTADGYGSETVLGENQSVSPLAAPDSTIAVADLLP
ncbi:MAG: Uma2 family endonuclease [Armatimonadota bacterium]|nr:Uma2 family endonuclease [Armatimonadota bacterium]